MKAKEKISTVAQNNWIRNLFTIISLGFIVSTYFIALKPNGFLKFGYVGVFAFNIVASGLILIPIVANKLNVIGIIMASAVGNLINTSFNYFVGYGGSQYFSNKSYITKLESLIERFGLIMVYILAIIPLPLDFNGLLSGYLRIPYKKYVVINFLGKITIFSLLAFGIISLPKILNH